MRNLKDSSSVIRQNEAAKKSKKHDANLQKNSTLYFQVGLIVCLLVTYGLFEMKFETTIPTIAERWEPDDNFTIEIPVIKPEQKSVAEPVVKKRVVNPTKFIPIKDNPPTVIETPIQTNALPLNPDDIVLVNPPVDTPPVDFIKVEEVPVFPGCEKKKGREAKSKCMSEKITKIIQRKFDVELANELGLIGVQKIQVQFKIDKMGKVTEIKTRAPHPLLSKEAERVVDLIPDMIPGKQRDKPVAVRYNLPINFKVQN